MNSPRASMFCFSRFLIMVVLYAWFSPLGSFAQDAPLAKRSAAPATACIKAVVIDFPQAPRAAEYRDLCRQLRYQEKDVITEKDRRGWFFGSQDIYSNANNGRIFSDILAAAIHNACIYDVRSRSDVKIYYADKRDILTKKLGLSGKELDHALLKLNPVMIGREMGVDKVVTGYIVDAELRKSRTFGYFASVANINVAIYDVKSGQREFCLSLNNYRGRSTQYGNFEAMADEFVRSLRAFYAGPAPARPEYVQARN